MLGCSTVCPNCSHQFQCCLPVAPPPPCCASRRSIHGLSGGGLVTSLPPQTGYPSPEISPSVPLTFVIPNSFVITPHVQLAPRPPPVQKPELELARLSHTVRALHQSGWYYEGLTFDRSDELLKDTKVGTFLVRNSSDPRFLFSLSVQTDRGPKSVRLFYVNGHFRLDAQPHLEPTMPLFPGVIELVQYYIRRKKSQIAGGKVLVDPQGNHFASIFLDRPLRKDNSTPSLKHLARLAINKSVDRVKNRAVQAHSRLELPTSLIEYLKEYPYTL